MSARTRFSWRGPFVAGFRGLSELCYKAHRLFKALAVGFCDRETLLREVRRGWSETGTFQSEIVVKGGLMKQEEDYLALVPPHGRIAVVGCGGGRDLLAFAARGRRADGVDLSPDSCAHARAMLREAKADGAVYCGDAAEFVFPSGPYDLVVFSWSTYGYIPGRERRVRSLRNAASVLSPGGRVIVNVGLLVLDESGAAERLARWVGGLTRSDWRLERGDEMYSDLTYEHSFAKAEIEDEARDAGLTLERWLPTIEINGGWADAVLAPRPPGAVSG